MMRTITDTNEKMLGAQEDRGDLFVGPWEIKKEAGEQVPWIVPGLIPEGALIDIYGEAKHAGKTTFSLAMVKAVLHGLPFLDEPTQQTPVVYLTEQGNNIVKAFNDVGIHDDEGLFLLPRGNTYGMTWDAIVDVAVTKAIAEGSKLMFVDTLPAWTDLDGEQENYSGHVKRALKPLMRAAREYGIATWSIRHANRDGGARGSSQFFHDADILISLRRLGNDMPANVRHIKAEGRADDLLDTNVEFRDGTFYDVGAEKGLQREKAKKTITEVLKNISPLKREVLIEEAHKKCGVSKSTIGRALDDMGELDVSGKGVKGSPKLYDLPSKMAA